MNTAVTSRQSNSRLPITLNAGHQPPAEFSDQKVSGLTGAVHSAEQPPLKVIPAQIFAPVFLLDPSSGLLRLFQNLLLPFPQRLVTRLDPR